MLERAGLIVRTREAQFRRVRIEPAPLREVASWAEQYRVLWEQRYDAFDDYLKTIQKDPEEQS